MAYLYDYTSPKAFYVPNMDSISTSGVMWLLCASFRSCRADGHIQPRGPSSRVTVDVVILGQGNIRAQTGRTFKLGLKGYEFNESVGLYQTPTTKSFVFRYIYFLQKSFWCYSWNICVLFFLGCNIVFYKITSDNPLYVMMFVSSWVALCSFIFVLHWCY